MKKEISSTPTPTINFQGDMLLFSGVTEKFERLCNLSGLFALLSGAEWTIFFQSQAKGGLGTKMEGMFEHWTNKEKESVTKPFNLGYEYIIMHVHMCICIYT